MHLPPADRRLKAELLSALAKIPPGRVASLESLAGAIGAPLPSLMRLLGKLTDDERQAVPWHRVVAKGGAIGWGPHREAQFARLLREGVPVSPAGIVQDMARVALVDLESDPKTGGETAPQGNSAAPVSQRSRGMKDKPA